MPVTPTYPGVYIEELPSGIRTITGVATSITAFVGRAKRGPIDDRPEPPRVINSYGEFERIYGGLWKESYLGFAVRDFFLNGGSQAIIVRLYCSDGMPNSSYATLSKNALALRAADPGSWGNALRIRVDDDISEDVAKSFNLVKANLFNLFVIDTETKTQEVFRNVSMKESPRRVDRVLLNQSNLIRMKDNVDPSGLAEPTPHAPLTPGTPYFEDDNASSKVELSAQATDGLILTEPDFTGPGKEGNKQGLYALLKNDLFNLLCIPPYTADNKVHTTLVGEAAKLCEDRRAFLLVDPPPEWTNKETAKTETENLGTRSKNAAVFFPRLKQPNSLRDNQLEEFVPCGTVAGIFARTDAQRGVWKAPAGLESSLNGVPALTVPLTDAENGELNPLGINCLRLMPAIGPVVWGSRTLQGADRLASEWKYIPVRRTALFIEESLYRGLQWVVFEPNDEPLWAQIRLNVGAFMNNLFRQGAFQGKTSREAYFVKCDKETTTQNDINLGIVNILVGFAPLKPAEFVIVKLQQMAGQILT
jgi:uncharacterized protein